MTTTTHNMSHRTISQIPPIMGMLPPFGLRAKAKCLFLGGLFVSRCVPESLLENQTLAFCSLDRMFGSRAIVDLAVIPTELEFVAVAAKVTLGDMMECSVNTPLEQREVRFRRIRGDVTVHVLTHAVIDGLVAALKERTDSDIRSPVVGHDGGFVTHVPLYQALKVLRINAGDWTGYGFSIPLHQNHDGGFACSPSPIGTKVMVNVQLFSAPAGLAADVGFVALDDTFQLAADGVLLHRCPDAVSQMPSGFVGVQAEISLKLESRDAFLVRAHGVEGLDPLPQRDMATVHDGPHGDGELPPARVALNHAISDLLRLGIQAGDLPAAAVRACRTFRPTDTLKDCSGFIFSETSHVDGSHIGEFRKCRRYVFHGSPPFSKHRRLGGRTLLKFRFVK
jgi:hypothetical protein